MKLKSVVGVALFSLSSLLVAVSPLSAEDGQETVMMVCQNTGDKVGFEGNTLTKFMDQCAGSIAGLTFSSDDPVSGEDVAILEERCVDESESEEEEEFEQKFERCMVNGLLQALKDSAE